MSYKTLRFTLVSLLMMLCGTAFADWQKTETLTVGDVVIMAAETQTATKELTAVSIVSGNSIGVATDYTGTPAGTYPLTVVAGSAEGSIAFKTTDNTYLSWSGSKNNLLTAESVADASSWTFEFSNGVATVTNVGTTARILQYNSGSPRFACYGNSNQTKLTFWKQVAGSSVATPTFTPNGGKFVGTTSVEIACETEGATIYYSMNGQDPVAGSSPQYGRALPITETTTVKAIAVKGNDQSAVASATFTQVPSYSTFTSMSALASNAIFAYTGKAFIIAKPTDKYVYLYNPDARDFALIYDNSGVNTTAAEIGKYITPGWTGKVSIYNGLFELVPDNAIVVNDNPVQPVNYPAIALGTAVTNQVLTLKDVTYFSVDGKNISITVNNEDKDISEAQGVYGYNQFNITIPEFVEGKTYQIVGAIGYYKKGDIDHAQFWPIEITEQVEETPDALAEAKTALQTAIAIASNINPEGFADAITAAQAALTAEGATVLSIAEAAQTLETAIKAFIGEVLPNLGAIVTALNEETLNTAYANAQAALAKEDVTPQELAAAMKQIITAAQAVAPAHLQNLKGYAVKYGATDAATLIDSALAAIEAGNVSQIIATMTAVKEAATPLATSILTQMIADAQNYQELAEDVTAAQAALNGGNYITMIITAKALYAKLTVAEQFAVLTYKLGEQSTTIMTVKKGNMSINITAEEGWAVETLTVNGADKKDDFAEGKLTLSIDADTEVSVTFGWADAANLYTEDIATGIATIDGENVKVYAKDGQLCVDGAAGKLVRLYTVGGQLIASVTPSAGKTGKFSVPAGTYIVQVGSKAAKVVVK